MQTVGYGFHKPVSRTNGMERHRQRRHGQGSVSMVRPLRIVIVEVLFVTVVSLRDDVRTEQGVGNTRRDASGKEQAYQGERQNQDGTDVPAPLRRCAH